MCLDNTGVNICYLLLIAHKLLCCSPSSKSFTPTLHGSDMLAAERSSPVSFLLSKASAETILYKMKLVSVCVLLMKKNSSV